MPISALWDITSSVFLGTIYQGTSDHTSLYRVLKTVMSVLKTLNTVMGMAKLISCQIEITIYVLRELHRLSSVRVYIQLLWKTNSECLVITGAYRELGISGKN
jgi:hypothetical protein